MRLATLLGRQKNNIWINISCGVASDVRPLFKNPDLKTLEGVEELRYFDDNGGERRKRFIKQAPAAPATSEEPAKKRIRRGPRAQRKS